VVSTHNSQSTLVQIIVHHDRLSIAQCSKTEPGQFSITFLSAHNAEISVVSNIPMQCFHRRTFENFSWMCPRITPYRRPFAGPFPQPRHAVTINQVFYRSMRAGWCSLLDTHHYLVTCPPPPSSPKISSSMPRLRSPPIVYAVFLPLSFLSQPTNIIITANSIIFQTRYSRENGSYYQCAT